MATTLESRLGRHVAMLRQSAGLTQAQLAERCGVVNETISRLERGTTVPSVARLADIADALGVELHVLFQLRARATKKDEALERLLAVARHQKTPAIELIIEMVERMHEDWASALEGLLVRLRSRERSEIEAITEIVDRIFAEWG